MQIIEKGTFIKDGKIINAEECIGYSQSELANAYKGTIAYSILSKHSKTPAEVNKPLRIKFDGLASHDITYVGIIQTAKASGLKAFPLPYVLTNCHNSLCAVGGTINEDDHMFGLSACRKYGGIYVPAHQAVIHTYMREMMSGCGKMLLGSDSHTRYGALGTMAMGEGGPELVKQLLDMTYDINYPEVVAIVLKNAPKKGVGPHDVAIAIITEVFKKGLVKNKIMEFVGDGIANLPIEYRNGIDVMTTETACLSSIWQTDDKVKDYFVKHGRPDAYKELKADSLAYYNSAIIVDLAEIEPMIALPFHPSNGYRLIDVIENPEDIFAEVERNAEKHFGGRVKLNLRNKIKPDGVYVEQGIIAGCAGGTYDNICEAAAILKNKYTGAGEFNMSVYPSSQPVNMELAKNGRLAELIEAGVNIKSCFCGPCFGAGDVPANNELSIRHTTRNFENREGSKPSDGQLAAVALMDARSIAATAANGGRLTLATDIDYDNTIPEYNFNQNIYKNKVYYGWGNAQSDSDLIYGPNIKDWPEIDSLNDNILLKMVAVIDDPVTTTDELIPSGETSSYRSNPLRLAEFTLSRKVPEYVSRAKQVQQIEYNRKNGDTDAEFEKILNILGVKAKDIAFGSAIFANKPGDGSAREQAASCQRVLGGAANFARDYATKRYRSNLINWGILPFHTDFDFETGDYVYIPDVKRKVLSGADNYELIIIRQDKKLFAEANILPLTEEEKDIILKGCLINYYGAKNRR